MARALVLEHTFSAESLLGSQQSKKSLDDGENRHREAPKKPKDDQKGTEAGFSRFLCPFSFVLCNYMTSAAAAAEEEEGGRRNTSLFPY